jgi:hypothetical protein
MIKPDYDALLQANRLVEELGEAAVRISKVKLVELTAANQVRAAEFWRQVMYASEEILSRQGGAEPTDALPQLSDRKMSDRKNWGHD